jgi:hypothetical protein
MPSDNQKAGNGSDHKCERSNRKNLHDEQEDTGVGDEARDDGDNPKRVDSSRDIRSVFKYVSDCHEYRQRK